MKTNQSYRLLLLAGLTSLLMASIFACQPGVSTTPTFSPTTTPEENLIAGLIVDPQGAPLPGATVRIQATVNETQADEKGRFVLTGLEEGMPVTVSAWAEGYYCAKSEGVVPPADGILLTLHPYQTIDNPDYQWVPPIGNNSCYSCKPGVTQVWLENDAHARSATNPRFLTMYNGTDVDGNQSPLTRFVYRRDYGTFPLRPDPSQPYYGPGYKLDFSQTAGNCAACHTPGPAIGAAYAVDPNTVGGADTFGIHCDFCHKIADSTLDPATSLPYPNMPGVLSMDFRRPFTEDTEQYQLFFGTFDDDNVPEEDTYLPLIEESAFCAPCHFGVFWDTVVYNSYGEWLDSPYSDPVFEGARTCQQCHMPAPTLLNGQAITNVAPSAGGVARDPLTIHAHTFPGAGSEPLLQNALTMTMAVSREEGLILVDVTITNDQTGHHVPTDSPLRQMILLVQAKGSDDETLELLDGPVIPEWGGVGNPDAGYYAGLPGKIYAKTLMELWTEVSPTGAYWNPTRVVSDNRLAAFSSDISQYVFEAPKGEAKIGVTLLLRRAFIELMDQKGWDVPDIVMESITLDVP